MPSVSSDLSLAPGSQRPASRMQVVAVAGNPNSGKSTLFNALTGLSQKVGNYPGVTVEKKTGRLFGPHGESFELIDLPGTYSLQARSPDEAVSRDVILGRRDDTPAPSMLLCVVDASNLERNLYLVAQLAELGLPLVVALTMADLAERQGLVTNVALLAERLGCPVVPVVAAQRKGLIELKQALASQIGRNPPHRTPFPPALEKAADDFAEALARDRNSSSKFAFAESLLLLSAAGEEHASSVPNHLRPLWRNTRTALSDAGHDPLASAIQARYAWVAEIAAAAQHGRSEARASFSDKLDFWLTHRVWGWLFFFGVMALMFFTIFHLAETPMGWIEKLQNATGEQIKGLLPAGDLRDLVTDGIVAGVGGVIVFLPQILILFFFIGLLEDTGYMARAAFIIDRVMNRVGLHGKSFVPMLSSFACAIPGIMSARTIDNRKDRIVTILVAPLMSCSARLPVYTLLIALMLPGGVSAWHKAGLMLAMYLLGMIAAFSLAWLFRRTLFQGERSLLLLEMPPYRCPSLRVTLSRMWDSGSMFLRRAGTTILAISIIIWAISTFPKPRNPAASPSEALAGTIAGRLGHAIEPVIAPLGYDWKVGVGIVSSFAAREVFVGTMSIIYSIENSEDDPDSLRDAMLKETHPNGSPVYTPLVCLSLMVFYVLAMQCISTSVVVRRETGHWKWPLFQFAYMTILAWTSAFVIYQGGQLFGFH